MIHEFSREAFTAAIKKSARIAPASEAKPMLTNILFLLTEDEATIIATDLDVAVVARCPKLVATEGEEKICANAKQLLDIAQAVDGDSISISAVDSKLEIVSGGYSAQLPLADASDFPDVEAWDEKDAKEVPVDPFVEGINRCSFSIADNEAKMNLMAIKIGGGYIQATDGSVTAITEFTHDVGELLIPAPAVKDLVLTLRASGAAELLLKQNDSFIMFKAGEDLFLTRKSTASFPDILGRIVKATEALPPVFKADKVAMLSSFKRVGITSNARSKAAVCKVTEGKMEISSFNQAGASSKETIDIEPENVVGEISLLFNCDYVIDLLKSCHAPSVTLKFNSQQRLPVRFEDDDMTVFLMRLSDAMIRTGPEDESTDGAPKTS